MNFEDLSRKFKKFSQDTVTEVQKMNEVRQMNSRISDQKKQISVLYSQMGQKLYDHYKENPPEGFEGEFHELEERYAMIEKFKDQIRAIKGVRVCPHCHTEVAAAERFCSSCGEKLPEVLRISEDDEGNVVIEGTAAEVEEDTVTDEPKRTEETPVTDDAEQTGEPEGEEVTELSGESEKEEVVESSGEPEKAEAAEQPQEVHVAEEESAESDAGNLCEDVEKEIEAHDAENTLQEALKE